MRTEEEGVPRWGDKRLEQLNFLWKHVGGALKHVVFDRDGTLMRILKPSSPGK